MKAPVFLLLALFTTFLGHAQSALQDGPLQDFAAIYTAGEKWDNSLPPAGQAYFIEHSRFLSDLRTAGVITVGMRVSDKGIILLKAKSLEEATKIFDNDISVKEKTFRVEVQPATVFYKGCLGGI